MSTDINLAMNTDLFCSRCDPPMEPRDNELARAERVSLSESNQEPLELRVFHRRPRIVKLLVRISDFEFSDF